MTKTLSVSKASIGENRGTKRIWLQGLKLSKAGFLPGERYQVQTLEERSMLIIERTEAGARIVSRKSKGEKEIPVVDINNTAQLAMFEGIDAVRVIFEQNKIYILPVATEMQARERLQRLQAKLDANEPLLVASLAHGGGVLSNAVHHGLAEGGVEAKLAFAVEIDDELLDHAAEHNDVWEQDSRAIAMPMQELASDPYLMDSLPKVEILEAGLPCSGASVAGRAKRGLEHPESHPEVGHLLVPFLAIIAKVQPAAVILENVPQYANSASMAIIRNSLRDMGYDVHLEGELNAADWGTLEHRKRMAMVAVTRGIPFDFSRLERNAQGPAKAVQEVLDPIGEDDPSWTTMSYLKDKEVRDKAAGKGFMMQLVDAQATKVPTITKGYMKRRSTDPFLRHPSNPDLLRLFTPGEHARIKGIPEALIEGLSATAAHVLLGQSVAHRVFRSIGKLTAESLRACTQGKRAPAEAIVAAGNAGINNPAPARKSMAICG